MPCSSPFAKPVFHTGGPCTKSPFEKSIYRANVSFFFFLPFAKSMFHASEHCTLPFAKSISSAGGFTTLSLEKLVLSLPCSG